MYSNRPRTLPYNRLELLSKLRQIHTKLIMDWKTEEQNRKTKILTGLDEQIKRLQECKRIVKAGNKQVRFRAYVSFYGDKGPTELGWPEEKPRDFFPIEYAIKQLEMSPAKIVRLRDDDSVVRILAGGPPNA
jgi:hypothetical protein